jgi:hypothetical protein
MKCSPTIIESDSLELFNAYNGITELWAPFTPIMIECFQIIQSIGGITVQHCPREVNKAAHNIAKLSYDSNHFVTWNDNQSVEVLVDILIS